MNYDFSQLNDKEFEILARDLVSVKENTYIERFKPGRDSGIDGRFFISQNKQVILQAKHYLKSGYSKMKRILKNEELDKIKKLSPNRYILITSLPLSPKNKVEIKNIFGSYIKRDDDILGQEDLNDLLRSNPEIEKAHFKLWITSTSVLGRFLNNAIHGRSEYFLDKIKFKSKLYVATKNHDKALEILNKKKAIVISGEPGVGKTTLAENLCTYFACKKYQLFFIANSIEEAERVYEKSKKQVFYYDDFLGSNYLDAFHEKKDSNIMNFIQRIANDKNHYLIMTSRSNIFNQGVFCSDFLRNGKIEKREFLLEISSLTKMDKAKILYNHIYFGNLDEKMIDELYKDKRYKDIINHKNFNPRLIEFITDKERLPEDRDYWEYVGASLDNPKYIWDHCFKIQIDDFERSLILLTVFNGGSIEEEKLKLSFKKLCLLENTKNTSNIMKDFNSILKVVTGSFLVRNISSHNPKENYISLFNPSITDYVLNECSHDNNEKLINIFKALQTKQSLSQLFSIIDSSIISKHDGEKIRNELIKETPIKKENYDYLLLLISESSNKKTRTDLINAIIKYPCKIKEFDKMIDILRSIYNFIHPENFDFLEKITVNKNLCDFDIRKLIELIEEFNIDNQQIMGYLKLQLEEFLLQEIYGQGVDFSSIKNSDHEGHESCVIEEITSICERKLSDFEPSIIEKLKINIDEIISRIDIESMENEFWKDFNPYDDYDDMPRSDFRLENDIDDLFDRS